MWLGCLVHPDYGAARPFDFKTQTTRVKYWLVAKCSSTIFFKEAAVRSAEIEPTKMRHTLQRPLVVLVGVQRNLESPFVASSTLFLTRNH